MRESYDCLLLFQRPGVRLVASEIEAFLRFEDLGVLLQTLEVSRRLRSVAAVLASQAFGVNSGFQSNNGQ